MTRRILVAGIGAALSSHRVTRIICDELTGNGWSVYLSTQKPTLAPAPSLIMEEKESWKMKGKKPWRKR